ncbi:c-Myc-binding protein homolog [Condylostylus longicornis]|uniref:c-Myc-binding protein homolog n=1 Tax=Condylostylus longicornis TaxID=2530218 RepID=UPI00244DE2A0|nr:c-Myc-binding protein homolog [Condylostylus longicornis]
MSFKPIDSRRDEFRKYLERSGVIDEFTKVLIKLFNTQERPENAIQFIFENLGHTLLQKDQYECLKKELEDSRNEIAELKCIIEKLQTSSKIVNQESVNKIETLVDVKQEPVESDTSEQNNDVNSTVGDQISSFSEIQQGENVNPIKLEQKSEVSSSEKTIGNSESSTLPDSNNVEAPEAKENTESENAKNSEEEKTVEVGVKKDEEVTSTSNVKSEANVSETSTKDNIETVKSTEPEESTNTEKPPAEENKADEAKK